MVEDLSSAPCVLAVWLPPTCAETRSTVVLQATLIPLSHGLVVAVATAGVACGKDWPRSEPDKSDQSPGQSESQPSRTGRVGSVQWRVACKGEGWPRAEPISSGPARASCDGFNLLSAQPPCIDCGGNLCGSNLGVDSATPTAARDCGHHCNGITVATPASTQAFAEALAAGRVPPTGNVSDCSMHFLDGGGAW